MFFSGSVEALIFGFISVCIALIVYDIVCTVSFRRRDFRIRSIANDIGTVERFLSFPQLLKSEERLLGVEAFLDEMLKKDPEQFRKYKEAAAGAFSERICDRKRIDDIVMAYIVFLSAKYSLFYRTNDETLKTELLFMTENEELYLRENILRCICSVGDEVLVYKALSRLDNYRTDCNGQLVQEDLKQFAGDRQALANCLRTHFSEFGAELQSALTAFLGASGGLGVSDGRPSEESSHRISGVMRQ